MDLFEENISSDWIRPNESVIPAETVEAEIVPQNDSKNNQLSTKQKLGAAVADNFGNILKLAGDIVEIGKMKVQTDAIVKKMAEDRRMLLAEAEAYAIKKRAQTNDVVQRMQLVREMMNDFYNANNQTMTSADFCTIITKIVDEMGRVADGSK